MKIEIITENNIEAALIQSDEILLKDMDTALDLMADVQYETGCRRMILPKKNVAEDFFILSTKMAGEILQKYMNYQVKLAVYGDFSGYSSKALKDFIYESNQGRDFFFTATKEEAVSRICR